MNKTGIVADSAVCIPGDKIRRYNIRLVPEIIIFGEKQYRDGIDLKRTEFYSMLKAYRDIPTTSAPSPEDFIAAFEETAQNAESIVCILVTAGFSSMGYQSALKAKEVLPGIPIEIIDSRTAVGAYGFIVLAAAEAAASGKSMEEVIRAAEDMKQRVHMMATLKTLKYLARGGRIGKAAQWASSIMNIKPIISVPTSTGVLEPLERIQSRKKSLVRLLELVEQDVDTSHTLYASIDHAGVCEEAEWLKKELTTRFGSSEISINDWAPVAGVHCGPGVIGISFYSDTPEDDTI